MIKSNDKANLPFEESALKERLKQDAEQFNSKVSELTKQRLAAAIAKQSVEASSLKPEFDLFHNRFALAATLSAIAITGFLSLNTPERKVTEVAEHSGANNQTFDLGIQPNWNAQTLSKESEALQKDMEKMRKRLLSL